MRFINLIFFLLTTACFGQLGGINVHLKTGKVINTRYAYLFSGYSDSYLIIHERKGEKIMIREVDHVEGMDQNGDYRYIKPIAWNSDIWAEKVFTSDRIEIYATDIVTGSMKGSDKFKNCLYKKDGGELKSLKLKNLKVDLAGCEESLKHLKKGKSVALAQAGLYVAGYSLITIGIIDFVGKTSTDDNSDPETNNVSIPPLVIAGLATVYTPFLLNSEKKKHYLEALKAYK